VFYERSDDVAQPRVEQSGARRHLLLPRGGTYFVSSRRLASIGAPQRRPDPAPSRDHPEREFVPLRVYVGRARLASAVDLNTLELPPGKRAYVYVYDGSVGTLTPLR
jgi:hypothetical protein